jgi:hypothetical protein
MTRRVIAGTSASPCSQPGQAGACLDLTRGRLGLDRRASGDVGHLFTSAHATVASVTGVAWVFLVLGGLSVAASLQGLYQRVFGLDSRTTRDVPRALTWLVLLVAWLYASGWAGPRVRAGGPAGFAAAGLVLFTLFWWVTMWLLLAGQIPWRGLLPCAVATGVCWLGMEAVFAVIFSGMVTSDDQKYGPIGTVFALMSYENRPLAWLPRRPAVRGRPRWGQAPARRGSARRLAGRRLAPHPMDPPLPRWNHRLS